MVRGRFRTDIRPVNSVKHIVDVATVAVPAGVTSSVPVIVSVGSPTTAGAADINRGARVNAIFLRVEAVHNSGTFVTIPRVYMTVQKNPGNNLGTPYPASVGSTDNRKWVIHQEMQMHTGISADSNSFPRTMFLGVIKIPGQYARFGIEDRLTINFALDAGETTATVSVCVQCIYKEFF